VSGDRPWPSKPVYGRVFKAGRWMPWHRLSGVPSPTARKLCQPGDAPREWHVWPGEGVPTTETLCPQCAALPAVIPTHQIQRPRRGAANPASGLTAIMERQELTDGALAARVANMSAQRIANFRTGKEWPTTSELSRLSRVLEVPVTEIAPTRPTVTPPTFAKSLVEGSRKPA
jgi:hypothetical protein